MERYLIITILLITSQITNAQKTEIKFSLLKSCSWDGVPVTGKVYEYTSDNNEALEVINTIVNSVGLKPNFSIRPYDGPNALAVNNNGERIIFYNPSFLKTIDVSTNTNWASLSVLAHEIGHHLNGHPLDGGNGRAHFELEADEFSGFVLHKLKASLNQAQIAIIKFLPNEGSNNYPPKSARLKAIETGWNKDEPTIIMSQDFKEFVSTLPRTIVAKPKSTLDNSFTGKGTINLTFSNNRITIKGDFDYSISGDYYFAKMEGNFSGEYIFTQSDISALDNFPIKLRTNISGDFKITSKKGKVAQKVFDTIFIMIDDSNNIYCMLEDLDPILGQVLSDLNFRL
jgi:hypothetical protein